MSRCLLSPSHSMPWCSARWKPVDSDQGWWLGAGLGDSDPRAAVMPVELESWFQKRSANLKTELNQDPTRRSLNSGRCQRATIMMTMAQLIMSAVGVSYGGISNSHCRLMSRRKNRAQEPGVCQLWRWWCAVGLGVQLANDPGLETIQVFGGPDRHNFRAWPPWRAGPP